MDQYLKDLGLSDDIPVEASYCVLGSDLSESFMVQDVELLEYMARLLQDQL
jgi:hypothetical protein